MVLAIVYGVTARYLKLRGEHATIKHTRVQTTKTRLDALDTLAESQRAQLDAIADALVSDSPARPSESSLARLEAQGTQHYASLVKHLRAREEARRALPDVVALVNQVQARRLDYERELAEGLQTTDKVLLGLRDDLQEVNGRVAELIREIADSPRIYVSDDLPADPIDGDIWLQPPSPPAGFPRSTS